MRGLDCLFGLGVYLVVCLAGLLCGRGLLRLLRLRPEPWCEAALAPLASFAACTLVLGLAGALAPGVPLKFVVPVLLAGLLAAAFAGAWGLRTFLRAAWLPLAVTVLLPVAALGSAFRFGLCEYPRTLACDGHAYIAGALYRWECSRAPGQAEPLTPVLQFARTTRDHARYISFSLLALLSPLVSPGDPLRLGSLLHAWALFVLGGSVLLFGLTQRQAPARVLAVTAFSVLGGWVADMVWANNYDNLLGLCYAPGVAGLLALGEHRRPAKWLLLGVVLGAALYTYPEGSVLILIPAGCAALPGLWGERAEWRWWLGGSLASAALAGLLLLPALKLLVPWLQGIAAQAAQGPDSRPGQTWFLGLMDPRVLPSALWGLSGESYGKPYLPGMNAAGLCLTALLAVGAGTSFRERRWGLVLALALPLGLAASFLLRLHYGYGAYKALTFGWWCVAGLTVDGFVRVVRLLPAPRLRVGVATAATAVALVIALRASSTPVPLWESRWEACGQRLSEVRELAGELAAVAPPQEILTCVDDWLANFLAMYGMRTVAFHPVSYRGFMEYDGTREYMGLARRSPLRGTRWILTDDDPRVALSLADRAEVVWSKGPYRLWKPRPGEAGACICHVENNSRGYRTDPDGSSFWVGHNDTDVHVFAERAATLLLAGYFLPDNHLSRESPRDVLVRTEGGAPTRVRVRPLPELTVLQVPVREGMNRITLRVEDPSLPPDYTPPWLILRIARLQAVLWPPAPSMPPAAPGYTARGRRGGGES